jgi:hypothetical protein
MDRQVANVGQQLAKPGGRGLTNPVGAGNGALEHGAVGRSDPGRHGQMHDRAGKVRAGRT